jgi:hypothetical protein
MAAKLTEFLAFFLSTEPQQLTPMFCDVYVVTILFFKKWAIRVDALNLKKKSDI